MSTTYTAKGIVMRHANVAGAEVSSIRKTMVYTVHMYGHCSPSSQNVPLHPSAQVHVAGWNRQVPPFLHVGLHTAKRVGCAKLVNVRYVQTCLPNATQCSMAPPPYVWSSSAPPTLRCSYTSLEQSRVLHSDRGSCRQLQREEQMGVVRDRRILQLILWFTVGRTLTAVRSCPALAAHTAVRRDARPSILAGWGANGCSKN